MESLLEQYKHFSSDMKFSKREKLVRSLTWQQAIKPGTQLSEKEMKVIVEDLFKCNTPNITPNGHPTYMEFKKDYLEKLFKS
jgi:DNA mismatch repair protein MutL